MIAIILLMFIMWVYMKEQYYTHFVETTYTTEKALLNSVSINMENQMEAYINTGSGISVNEEILNNIQSLDEQDTDAYSIRNISDTLNRWVDPQVIRLGLGDDIPLARFRLKLPDYEEHKCELEIIERLYKLGLKPDAVALAEKFAYPLTKGKDRPDGGEL